MDNNTGTRIQKVLSDAGIMSRRKAEEAVAQNRVTVNGRPCKTGQKVDPRKDIIAVDGARIMIEKRKKNLYIMLNKPRGYVTTMNDERGRKTVMSLISDLPMRVYPVGRLDLNSEGLLLFTNDGDFANKVAHPSFNNEKTYEVHVRGDAAGAVEALVKPMSIDDHLVQAGSVQLLKQEPDGGILRIVVREGRNRQIRKMCLMCGLKVLSLRRTTIGKLELGLLKPGQWRHLSEKEVRLFG